MPPRGKQASGLLTHQKMLRAAMGHFLKKGYERTTTAEIAREAGMTPSSFFRAYSSKEALLLEFVKLTFIRQYDLARRISGSDDPTLLCAVEGALELYVAEASESVRELYVTAYSLQTTSKYIYRSMSERLYQVFSPTLPEAKPKDFYEMEIAVAGMIRSFMAIPCDIYFTIEDKSTRFLDCALKLYSVEKAERERIIATTLSMDLAKTAAEIVRTTAQRVEEGQLITDAYLT